MIKKKSIKKIELVADEQELADFKALMEFYGIKTGSALIRFWINRDKKILVK